MIGRIVSPLWTGYKQALEESQETDKRYITANCRDKLHLCFCLVWVMRCFETRLLFSGCGRDPSSSRVSVRKTSRRSFKFTTSETSRRSQLLSRYHRRQRRCNSAQRWRHYIRWWPQQRWWARPHWTRENRKQVSDLKIPRFGNQGSWPLAAFAVF